jgi:hypothetical protein
MLNVLDTFGPPHASVPPSQLVRRWDHALCMGAGGFALGLGATAYALWRPLPGLPDIPMGGLLNQLVAYPALLAHALTAGHVYPLAWMDNPAAGQVPPLALHVRLLPAWLAGAALGGWLFYRGLTPHSQTFHVAGPQVLEGRQAEQSAQAFAARARGSKKASGFLKLHPALDLPKRTWCRHVFIAGSVGSGKTQIIYPIVRQIVQKKKKLFLLDVKGDYTAAIRRATILSPWDRRSAYWDIAADVRTSAQAAAFASSMIPSDQGANQFFGTAAELILTGCLRALQKNGGTRWHWDDLEFLLTLSAKELAPILAEHYAKAQPMVTGSETTAGSVLATLAAHTRTVTQLAEAFGSGKDEEGKPRKRLSLVAWARDNYTGRSTIIAQAGPDSGLTQRYLSAAINVIVPEIISASLPDDVDEDGRAIFFILDELAAVGKVNLAPLVDKGRSKGVSVVIGVQDLAQIAAIYGEHFAKALPGMVGTHLITQTQMGTTRDQLAAMLGKRRVAITVKGSAHGEGTVHEEMRALVQPTDLTLMLGHRSGKRYPNGFAIRALAALGEDLLVLDWPGESMPKQRRGFVPAKWTLPAADHPSPSGDKSVDHSAEGSGRPVGASLDHLALAADVLGDVKIQLASASLNAGVAQLERVG